MNIKPLLQNALHATMQRIRDHLAPGAPSRERLEKIAAELRDLVSQGHFEMADYPLPEGTSSILYKLSEDEGGTCTLYANRIRGAMQSPPHDHKTWAVIAAVEGTEMNTLYEWEDGTEGRQRVVKRSVVELRDGASIALMPLDVHSIRIEAGVELLNLHLYGIGIDRQSERLLFNADGDESGHYAPQPLIR